MLYGKGSQNVESATEQVVWPVSRFATNDTYVSATRRPVAMYFENWIKQEADRSEKSCYSLDQAIL